MAQTELRIALWDEPMVRPFAAHLAHAASELAVSVQLFDRRTCAERLRAGQADVALVPTITALSDPDAYDVLPAVSISSWKNRFARIFLTHGLEVPAKEVQFDVRFAQEAVLARLVLREHYDMEPKWRPVAGQSVEQLIDEATDAALAVGERAPLLGAHGHSMDLGQEWSELTNYPMVWGVFSMRKGEGDPAAVELLREAALQTEASEVEDDDPFGDQTRYRLDDLATASLTELANQLYYLGVTEDLRELQFGGELPGDQEDEQDASEIED